MDKDEVARAVLSALGGQENVLANSVCMTRLRITLNDPARVDYDSLTDVKGVLGTASRGNNCLEVVFGPRVIEELYRSFTQLTGKAAGSDDLFPMTRPESGMRVQIRTNAPSQSTETSTEAPQEEPLINESEIGLLEHMFRHRFDDAENEAEKQSWRLLVINGPNLNMLGVKNGMEDGNDGYPTLLELCKNTAKDVGFIKCDCFQSNHEGDLIDKIQDAFGLYEAIVINPGAYGSSIALRDSLRSVPIPCVEVHLHKHDEEDEIGKVCVAKMCGHGTDGYRKAIILAAQHLNQM